MKKLIILLGSLSLLILLLLYFNVSVTFSNFLGAPMNNLLGLDSDYNKVSVSSTGDIDKGQLSIRHEYYKNKDGTLIDTVIYENKKYLGAIPKIYGTSTFKIYYGVHLVCALEQFKPNYWEQFDYRFSLQFIEGVWDCSAKALGGSVESSSLRQPKEVFKP